MTKVRRTAYFWLLLNTLTWGLAFVMVKPAFEFTTPLRFLFWRYLAAVTLSLPILWYYLRHRKIKLAPLIKDVLSLELLGTTLALALLYTGLSLTTTIEANLLSITQPFFVTLGGIWLLKEKQEDHEWLGLLIAFGGTIWLTLQTNGFQGVIKFESILGNLLILSCNFVNMFYFPLAKKKYRTYPKFLVTTLSFYVGLISFGLLSLVESQWSVPAWGQVLSQDFTQPAVWAAAGYTAIFVSIIGLTAYIKGQDKIEASEASWFWYLQALIAIPAGVLILHEHVAWSQIAALSVVLAGVIWAERRSKRKRI